MTSRFPLFKALYLLLSLFGASDQLTAIKNSTGELQFLNIMTPVLELFTLFRFHDVPSSIMSDLPEYIPHLVCGPKSGAHMLSPAERYRIEMLSPDPHLSGRSHPQRPSPETLELSASLSNFNFFNAVHKGASPSFVCGINGKAFNYFVEIKFQTPYFHMSKPNSLDCQPWTSSIQFSAWWYKIDNSTPESTTFIPVIPEHESSST